MSSKPSKSNSRPVGTGTVAENHVLARAVRKLTAGQEMTKVETDALKRHEKQREEELRWKYYRSIPQKHWRQMSGRQTKVLKEQAERYGIPFGGATINLPDVVKALHEFLATNAVRLARDPDDLMNGEASPALERYREERAKIARLDRMEREGLLIPREKIREFMNELAALIARTAEAFRRRFGDEAAAIIEETLQEFECVVRRRLGQ